MRQRRKVHAHSGYLLATAIFLMPPIFGRLMAIPLGVRGPEDFSKLGTGFQIANLGIAAFAFAVAYRRGRHGKPFALAGALTLIAAFLYQTVGGTAAWEALFARAADLPTAPFAFAAGAAGVVIGYAGWIAGRRPSMPDALPA
jgi:type IV secretory pathway VirB2 component (pilin)